MIRPMNRKQRRSHPPTGAAKLPPAIEQALAQAARLHQAGRLREAEDIVRGILRAVPPSAVLFKRLGAFAGSRGEMEMAAQFFARAAAADPKDGDSHAGQGKALLALGRWGEAAASLRTALARNPRAADWHLQLGVALAALGKLDESILSLRQAAALNPAPPEAHYNLARALSDKGLIAEAVAAYETALTLRPEFPEALYNLGNALLDQGRAAEAMTSYRRCLTLRADDGAAHANMLLASNYSDTVTAATALTMQQAFGAAHGAQPMTPKADRSPERRLRIGYLSQDFRRHSCAYFIEPLLAAHDRAAVEVFCYSASGAPDEMTDRLKSLADHWREVTAKRDADIAEAIRADGIDVMVELGGHTAASRLTALASKPAPVQLSWLGYPDSTGLPAIDRRVGDAVTDPEPSDAVLRLEGGFHCYRPPADAPDVSPPPALAAGAVTFCSFNTIAKLSPAAVALWSRVLTALPESRLLLKSRHLSDPGTRRRLLDLFAAHGITESRIEALPHTPATADHLDLYRRADIALDTFPYAGTTTTCEALWMGVPVVTLTGERPASRVGASLLSQIGLSRLVAASGDEFVVKAVALAADLPALAALRAELRARMAASPLCDAAGFARRMENAYRDLWRQACADV